MDYDFKTSDKTSSKNEQDDKSTVYTNNIGFLKNSS